MALHGDFGHGSESYSNKQPRLAAQRRQHLVRRLFSSVAMGTGASVSVTASIADAPALSPEAYVQEHHRFYEAFKNAQWAEAYPYVSSQTSAGALAALGEANYANCIRFAVGAVGHTQAGPQDVEQAALGQQHLFYQLLVLPVLPEVKETK